MVWSHESKVASKRQPTIQSRTEPTARSAFFAARMRPDLGRTSSRRDTPGFAPGFAAHGERLRKLAEHCIAVSPTLQPESETRQSPKPDTPGSGPLLPNETTQNQTHDSEPDTPGFAPVFDRLCRIACIAIFHAGPEYHLKPDTPVSRLFSHRNRTTLSEEKKAVACFPPGRKPDTLAPRLLH